VPRLRAGAPDAGALFAPLAEFGTIGLAVSGGADSLALMVLARRFAATTALPPRFIVYSVDHGLRPEAAGEAAFVAAEAEKRGFEARILRWRGRKPKTGIQAAARAARYRLFAEAMAADGAAVLATAHHLHDQAETVLMRLAHASGVGGLRGMDYLSEVGAVRIVRPLLAIDPAALRQVVEAEGLVAVADPSNADMDYERVRWRQMLPQLAELGLTPTRLAAFARRMRDADSALLNMAAQAWGEAVGAGDAGHVIDRRVLIAIPRAIAVRVVARALAEVGGAGRERVLAPVEVLTDRVVREPDLRTTLNNCLIVSSGDIVRVSREPLKGARARPRKATPGVTAH
jgi:tRNA(Ile)-lysidine synthase